MLATLIDAPSQAAPFSAIYFFGDSINDTGNAGNRPPAVVLPDGTVVPLPSSGAPDPAQGYFTTAVPGLTLGRFSSGPLWPEYLADQLGLDATAAVAGGTNFAVAGAVTSQLALEILAFRAFFFLAVIAAANCVATAASAGSATVLPRPSVKAKPMSHAGWPQRAIGSANASRKGSSPARAP